MTTTVLSSTEAELAALAKALTEVIFVRDIMEFLGFPQQSSPIYQDNQSAIQIAEKGYGDYKNTKHFDIKLLFVHDHIVNGQVHLVYQNEKGMTADILTKAMKCPSTRQRHTNALLGYHNSDKQFLKPNRLQ
jgi:hypothetical protein